jgi:hypothetical protein
MRIRNINLDEEFIYESLLKYFIRWLIFSESFTNLYGEYVPSSREIIDNIKNKEVYEEKEN